MQKIELGNLIESPTPLENINDLWVDIDENTGDIKAIHRYNKDKGEWEPYIVSVDYIKPEGEEATVITINSEVAVRVSNIAVSDGSSGMNHQLIQVVLPESPYYGNVVGSHSRVSFLSENNQLDEEDENSTLMDVVLGFNNRNGYPFNCADYKASVLRIVDSESNLTTDSTTITYDGCIPYIKFIFHK